MRTFSIAVLGLVVLGALGTPGCGGTVDGNDDVSSGAAAQASGRDPAIVRSYGGMEIPASGAYFGADDTTRGFTSSNGIETQLGRRMGIRNRHYGWEAACPSAETIADAKLTNPKVIPMVSLEGAGHFPVKSSGWQGGGDLSTTHFGKGIDRITNGEFDGYFKGVAQGLKALHSPVIVRLWMEMNGAHNPYYAAWQGGVGKGGETAFAAAYRHVVQVFHDEGASLDAGGNCIFVFCPQTSSSAGEWENYWPGDSSVDFMGLDLYRDTFAERAQNASANQNFYGWATSRHMPFMIAEAGFQQGVAVSAGGKTYDKDGLHPNTGNSLIEDTQAAIKQNPQCVAYVTWNNQGPVGDDFIDTSTASLAQYKAWAKDPYYALTR